MEKRNTPKIVLHEFHYTMKVYPVDNYYLCGLIRDKLRSLIGKVPGFPPLPFDFSTYYYTPKTQTLTFVPCSRRCPYGITEELVSLSKMFPLYTFCLMAEDEPNKVYYHRYFVDGRMCTCPGKVEIVYPVYDPGNLKPFIEPER